MQDGEFMPVQKQSEHTPLKNKSTLPLSNPFTSSILNSLGLQSKSGYARPRINRVGSCASCITKWNPPSPLLRYRTPYTSPTAHPGIPVSEYTSNSRSIILFSSQPSGIIPPIVVDFPSELASRSTQHHKMFTKKRINKPSLVYVYIHNGNCCEYTHA